MFSICLTAIAGIIRLTCFLHFLRYGLWRLVSVAGRTFLVFYSMFPPARRAIFKENIFCHYISPVSFFNLQHCGVITPLFLIFGQSPSVASHITLQSVGCFNAGHRYVVRSRRVIQYYSVYNVISVSIQALLKSNRKKKEEKRGSYIGNLSFPFSLSTIAP